MFKHQDSYLVLLQAGFALPFLLPKTRCALTAPFHPYQTNQVLQPDLSGGIFSVALSVGSHLPDVIWRFTLWSPDFPLSMFSQTTTATGWLTQSTIMAKLAGLVHGSFRHFPK